MAYQKERFASFLKQEMAQFFSRQAASNLPEGAFVSVSRAEMSESGEEAKVYILIFPAEVAESAYRDLKKLEHEARKYISEKLKRRLIPKIKIMMDEGTEKKMRLEKLLETIENK